MEFYAAERKKELISFATAYSLMSGSVIPPTLFFFLKISVAILGLLWSHINI